MGKKLTLIGLGLLLAYLYITLHEPAPVSDRANSTHQEPEKSLPKTSLSTPLKQQSSEDETTRIATAKLEDEIEVDAFVPYLPVMSPEHQDRREPEQSEQYMSLFPTDGVGHVDEVKFGVVDEYVSDIIVFLKSHLATRGGDAVLTNEKRSKSLFFKLLDGKTFNGSLQFDESADTPNFFMSLSNMGSDTLRVEFEGNTLERRTIPASSQGIWRLDLLMSGMLLFQNRCPYNKAFDYEKKQMFYFTKSRTLGATIYCNRRQEAPYIWHPIGFIIGTLK